MRLLEYVAVGLVLLALGVVIVIAQVFIGLALLFRPFFGTEPYGVAAVTRTESEAQQVELTRLTPARPEEIELPNHADPGDETDIAAEGLGDPSTDLRRPHRLFCVVCGHGDAIASFDAELLSPCPDCGGTRWGSRPDLPILGEPKELLP